jgi:peptidoglycan/LPS O-acetylase OafA/YrhL
LLRCRDCERLAASLITPTGGVVLVYSSAPRIHAIDYLRGLFALSILVYHYADWSGVHTATLEKLGIYGVCAFYVISGISFGYIYRDLRLRLPDVVAFGIKRFFRLAPLFWLATLAALMLRPARLVVVLANLTLAFGIISPGAYIPTGGWSIGNEVAFYCLFPFAVLCLRRSRKLFALVVLGSVIVAVAYTAAKMPPGASTLAQHWISYIQPWNQAYLFLAGVGVAWGIGRVTLSATWSFLLLAGLLLTFVVLPIGTDQITIVTGWPRLAYVAVCVGICAVGALGTLSLPALLDRILAWLGGVSYAVYLLHPLVFDGIARALPGTSPRVVALLATPLALVAADFVYRTIEAPMIRVGKRVADRAKARPSWSNGEGALTPSPAPSKP